MPGHTPGARAALLIGLGLGSGCGSFGLTPWGDSGLLSDDSDVLLALRIDSLSPSWAPLAGGTSVTVNGAGFEGVGAFWFGGSEVEISLINEESFVVTTPEVFSEAIVDVQVESDLGSFTLDDGFNFTDTEPEDPDDDTGEGGASSTGLIGGMVEFDYIVVGCPSCFGFTDYLTVEGFGIFHEGVSGSWTDWIPANGSCVVDPDRNGPTGNSKDIGEHVYLESGTSVSLDLQRTNQGGTIMYMSNGLSQDDYIKNAAYDLVLPDSGSNLSDMLLTTSGLDTFSPTNILNDTMSGFPNFSGSNARFSWSPTGVADSYLVNIQVYSASGATVLGDVVCAGPDSGSLTVPSSYLSSYRTGSLLAIYFYRWNTNEQVDPVSGNTIQGVSAFGGLGTGTLRP